MNFCMLLRNGVNSNKKANDALEISLKIRQLKAALFFKLDRIIFYADGKLGLAV